MVKIYRDLSFNTTIFDTRLKKGKEKNITLQWQNYVCKIICDVFVLQESPQEEMGILEAVRFFKPLDTQ